MKNVPLLLSLLLCPALAAADGLPFFARLFNDTKIAPYPGRLHGIHYLNQDGTIDCRQPRKESKPFECDVYDSTSDFNFPGGQRRYVGDEALAIAKEVEAFGVAPRGKRQRQHIEIRCTHAIDDPNVECRRTDNVNLNWTRM